MVEVLHVLCLMMLFVSVSTLLAHLQTAPVQVSVTRVLLSKPIDSPTIVCVGCSIRCSISRPKLIWFEHP